MHAVSVDFGVMVALGAMAVVADATASAGVVAALSGVVAEGLVAAVAVLETAGMAGGRALAPNRTGTAAALGC